MKKLLIAALAVSAVGSAFAAPLVYDYKATAKHMYEKEQRAGGIRYYVKYVKTSKLEGYFVQDKDGASLLANQDLAGNNAKSEKKGFLVLINKSAEKNYRAPKIMPAQLDVKKVVTKVKADGSEASAIAEAYFYAGPFASFPDVNTPWDGSQDDGTDYMFYSGAAAPGVGLRAYGTAGSTLYLFGQHNTYNALNNNLATPAICAFGDAWMNGAGFGTIGTAVSGLCCGWEISAGGSSVKSLSGNLKGGLFLCSIGGDVANLGWFALGLEDLYKADAGGVFANGHVVQGNDGANPENNFDERTWADGDITLATTDVVSGSWTLKPASAKKFKSVALAADETAWFNTNEPAILGAAGGPVLLQNIKGASQLLDKNYKFTTNTEPAALAGATTDGLISPNFAALFL